MSGRVEKLTSHRHTKPAFGCYFPTLGPKYTGENAPVIGTMGAENWDGNGKEVQINVNQQSAIITDPDYIFQHALVKLPNKHGKVPTKIHPLSKKQLPTEKVNVLPRV